jgi:hypothetical protein
MSDKPELTPERRAEIADQVRAALRRPRPTMADHVANQKSFWLPLLADKHQFSAGLVSRLDAASRKLTALEQLADSGSAPLKFDLVLAELQHLQTIYQWNTDPDTIRGEKNMHGVSMGGKVRWEGKDWKSRAPELQAEVNRLHQQNPMLSYAEIKRKVAKTFGCNESTVRNHTFNPSKP